MTDAVNLSELLEGERKRAAKEASPGETGEQRARRRLLGRFHDTLSGVWSDAHLLTDEELQWLSTVTEAAKAKGTRRYRRWSGRTDQVVRATNHDDAVRLDRMRRELGDRRWEREQQQRAADRRKVVTTLGRLGLPVPEYFVGVETPNDGGEDVPSSSLRGVAS
jgi:hypothetical protein